MQVMLRKVRWATLELDVLNRDLSDELRTYFGRTQVEIC